MRKTRVFPALSFTLAALAVLAWAPSSGAVSITEFPGTIAGTGPNVITVGPDGALWYTEFGSSNIGRITTAGVITEFPTVAGATPYGITSGPDGALWITDQNSAKIRRMTTSGVVTEFSIPSGNTSSGITTGRDGALWFTEQTAAEIGRITTAGTVSEIPISATQTPTSPGGLFGYSLVTSAHGAPTTIVTGPDGLMWFTEQSAVVGRLNADSSVSSFNISGPAIGIAVGPDGALWFVEESADKVGRLTTGGALSEFPVPTPSSLPFGITAGPDGALWFAEFGAGKISQITTAGAINEFAVPTPNSSAYTIVQGPDHALWFTESDGNRIGRLSPSGTPSPLVSSVLPSSRSVSVGNTATAFATIINGGTASVTGCTISPISTVPANFAFQTTDPATNLTTGTLNTPVNLAAGAAQTFVISFATTAQFSPTDTQLGFACTGVPAAPITSGLNTIVLSGSTTPVPDVVALVATLSNDGTLHIPGSAAAAAFSVATVNVGAGGAITATADTGPILLPLTITLCQTNPVNAQCTSPIGNSVSTTIDANTTPTFAVFANAGGTIPFAPGPFRIFVRFKDGNGVLRGETSVAVTTTQ